MKRTPLKRKSPLRACAPMRKRSRRSTPIRQAARGENCTVCLPGCPNDRDTTVLAHLRIFGGGGTGMKPSDAEAVFADAYCHDRIDGRVPWVHIADEFDFWECIARALVRTHRILRERGVLILKGEAA
jgi:hypothetical protein